jgi:hypothetical protein
MLAFDILAGGNSLQMSPGQNYDRKRTEKKEEMKNSGRRASHPRGTASSLLRSRTTSLPQGTMDATLSEAAASAYNNRPGPPPRRPLTSSAKPHYTKTKTPTKHQGLQGGVFKKIATWTTPPPTPTEFRFSPEENLAFGVWEVRDSPTMPSRRICDAQRRRHRRHQPKAGARLSPGTPTPNELPGEPRPHEPEEVQRGLHRQPPSPAKTTSAAAPHTAAEAPHRSINEAAVPGPPPRHPNH